MKLIEHQAQECEDWRPGVTTRMLVSAVSGSVQLCIFDQYCQPGHGAPTHLHAVEEVLTVLEGRAENLGGGRSRGGRSAGIRLLSRQASSTVSGMCRKPICSTSGQLSPRRSLKQATRIAESWRSDMCHRDERPCDGHYPVLPKTPLRPPHPRFADGAAEEEKGV